MISISVLDREHRTGLQYYDPQEQAWTPRILELGPTRSGVAISEVTAMKCLTVYACIRAISEDVAKLPLHLYQHIKPRGHERVRNHVADLLSKQPNPEMTAFDFKRMLQAHICTWGNAFAEIQFDESMQPLFLWPLPPDRMKVIRNKQTRELIYQFRPNYVDEPVNVPAWKMLHFKGLGFDGLVGYSPIRLAAENIGVSMAQERFAASFFGNGAYPGVILSHPMKLSPDAEIRLKQSWENAQRGSDNAHRTCVLQEGMKVDKMTLAPEEAQFLESRNFSVEEIARLYRVPPHKIGHLAHATFSNIEQQNKEYAIDCLFPYAVAWEQECDRKLNLEEGQFFKHKFNELMRADVLAQGTFYSQMRTAGAMTSNDIRDDLDLNPDENGGGDTLFIQGAMVPLDAASKGQHLNQFKAAAAADKFPVDNPAEKIDETTPAGSGLKEKNASFLAKIEETHVALLAEVLSRSLKIEAERVQKASKKTDFEAWKTEFYASHVAHLRGLVRPIAHNLAASGQYNGNPDVWIEQIVSRHVSESKNGLTKENVDNAVIGWNEARAMREAQDEIGKLIEEMSHEK